MKWGFFGPVHIASLILAMAIIVGLYFLLKRRSKKTQLITLGILSFSGVFAIVYNLLTHENPIYYLPLHLCSLNAMALPFAVLTRNKTVCNLLLVWSLGALIALVLNFAMVNVELLSDDFAVYYFPHIMEFGIPILLFKLGLAKKDPKCIVSTVSISMAAYTLAHFVNTFINNGNFLDSDGDKVFINYMFSVNSQENALTAFFYQIIPVEYWYMYMAVPVLVIYLCIVYLPQFLAARKARQTA